MGFLPPKTCVSTRGVLFQVLSLRFICAVTLAISLNVTFGFTTFGKMYKVILVKVFFNLVVEYLLAISCFVIVYIFPSFGEIILSIKLTLSPAIAIERLN